MKAIGYQLLPASQQASPLLDIELPTPVPLGQDILVEVKAIAVNPVDLKIYQRQLPMQGEWKILGWDATGVVVDTGPEVTMFKKGDAVWYAGAVDRPGSNSEFQLVEQCIAAKMPSTLSYAQAAALPLTAITAWELLFERLGVAKLAAERTPSTSNDVLLIVGAAGGVGSVLIQLARQLTGLTVIGTASRAETQAWVKQLGAHEVINHHLPLADEFQRMGINPPKYIASLTHTDDHFVQLAELIAPQGKIALIDDPKSIDVSMLKRKSVSLHWEFMFTRTLFNTADKIAQHHILAELATLVDAGLIRSTDTEHFGFITAENLIRAHRHIASGQAKGKVVLESFVEY